MELEERELIEYDEFVKTIVNYEKIKDADDIIDAYFKRIVTEYPEKIVTIQEKLSDDKNAKKSEIYDRVLEVLDRMIEDLLEL